MTDSLIAGADNVPAQPPQNFYEELVGEGKKFKSNEDLARGKWEADEFIRTKNKAFDDLSADYVRMREEYNAAQNLKQLADRLELLQKGIPSSDNNQTANEEKTAFDPEQYRTIARAEIAQAQQQTREETNYKQVQDKLKDRFGSNYQTVLKTEMERLGMSEKFTNDLARQNPNVFYRTFGLDSQNRENFETPPVSKDQRGFAPTTQKRTWSYYQNIKKTDPKRYLDPKTQIQMFKDAMELKDEFHDDK